jgi:hypothetical protein
MAGLFHSHDGQVSLISLHSSYSTGALTAGSGSTIGGVIGSDQSIGGDLANSDWDLDTSGIDDPSQGAGNIPNDPGITGLTDTQLKAGLPGGFDPAIWAQRSSINNGYPYLLANPPPK